MLAEIHLTVNQLGVRGVVTPDPFYSVDLLVKSNFQNEFPTNYSVVIKISSRQKSCAICVHKENPLKDLWLQ